MLECVVLRVRIWLDVCAACVPAPPTAGRLHVEDVDALVALSSGRPPSPHVPFFLCVRVLSSLLTALQAMHTRGYIHCDVHPGNVLTWGDRVALIDFGSAQVGTCIPRGEVCVTLQQCGYLCVLRLSGRGKLRACVSVHGAIAWSAAMSPIS